MAVQINETLEARCVALSAVRVHDGTNYCVFSYRLFKDDEPLRRGGNWGCEQKIRADIPDLPQAVRQALVTLNNHADSLIDATLDQKFSDAITGEPE